MKDLLEIFVIMRHGDRADKANESWSESESRPWDPPLSAAGWREASKQGSKIHTLLKRKPDMVFSSPYTRCLQTASAVIEACRLSFKHLIIDKGLSETYDYIHTVRAVASSDIMSGDKYKNMKSWFLSKREKMSTNWAWLDSDWKLRQGMTQNERVNNFVYKNLKTPKAKQFKLREQGQFPDFEMYANLGFNREGQVKRYAAAMERCRKVLKTSHKKPRKCVIVTHRAGVQSLYESMLNSSPGDIDTAGFFVVARQNKGKWTLLETHLARSSTST